MAPLSQLPYELLSLIIDYTADWITSLFTTPSTPSTSPKTQSRTSARTSSKAHPEAIHLVETVLKKTPIMSLHLRRHFHRITKLRQFSSQPAEETIPPPPHIYYQPTPPYELHDMGPPSWFEDYRVYLCVGEKLRMRTKTELKRMRDDYMGLDDDVVMLMWIDVAEGEIRTDLELLEGLVGIWSMGMLVRLKEDTPRTLCSSVTARKVTPE
ncbi:uncharacterized protein BO96DRAFT_425764 [Aspergillus niger CBS 101883]|uniref:uncharacterized protein n=1 Tax=Aspergillus lacticoffeatus (strain CBS 101883) TaxID=1450533 RepID=UPI000D7EE59F|nr:uncharacterized protein BO96DRAFT_425764 [Aspergillus niger CBS 101883]PYH53475.1 hypothetical protein BO96DRAFT_425764 [Aspergillus niger CBS 101883]